MSMHADENKEEKMSLKQSSKILNTSKVVRIKAFIFHIHLNCSDCDVNRKFCLCRQPKRYEEDSRWQQVVYQPQAQTVSAAL